MMFQIPYVVFNFSMSDLVAAEGRHHTSCRSNFENPVLKYASRGRPTSSDKLTAFNAICNKLEDDSKLYTIKEFHDALQREGDDVYSWKMTIIKLKEKYVDSVQFVNREGRSDIILLDYVSSILTKSWYNQEKSEQCDEAERIIIKTAAQILKDGIKNHKHETNFYPNIDDIGDSSNEIVEIICCRNDKISTETDVSFSSRMCCFQNKIFDVIAALKYVNKPVTLQINSM